MTAALLTAALTDVAHQHQALCPVISCLTVPVWQTIFGILPHLSWKSYVQILGPCL